MQEPEKLYRILIADDEAAIVGALKMLLRVEGFEVDAVRSPRMALESIAVREYETLLLDLNYADDLTSGREGIELLQAIRELDSQVPIIVMTGWATIDIALEAVRRGARDFIQKPWNDERLVSIVRSHAQAYRAMRQVQRLEAENRLFRGQGRPTFIAQAPAMRPIVEAISQVGPSDANILFTGEHGTGKEVAAKMLHAVSLRADKPLITVNTGGLPEGTFESELFGHVRGAYTDAASDRIGRFEMADGGTLFLDEIANVAIRQQMKLLRVLETGQLERVGSSRTQQVNVRVISATNADLQAECAAGNFREDLMFRLNTVEIRLPPLRERVEDIPALAAYFLLKYASRYSKKVERVSDQAMEKLCEYPWPGNVRELDHVIERSVILCRESEIQPGNLGLQTPGRGRSPDLSNMSLEEMESLLFSKALANANGNVSEAASAVGLSRGAFYRRIQKYGLHAPESPTRKEQVARGSA